MPISLTGSLNLSGSNTLIGTKTITGSVFISGSKTIIGTTSITGSLLVTGSLNTVGTITATTLVVQTITSSISSITGSTNFGSLSSNTHVFTGSMYVTGALAVGSGSFPQTFAVKISGSAYNGANVWFQDGSPTDGISFGGNGANSYKTLNTYGGALYLNQSTQNGLVVGGITAIGTTSTSSEANLFLGAQGTTEGGQLVLQKGTSQVSASHLDNYQNQFRVMSGTDISSSAVRFAVDMTNGNTTVYGALGLPNVSIRTNTISSIGTSFTTIGSSQTYANLFWVRWNDSGGTTDYALVGAIWYPGQANVIASTNNGGHGVTFQMSGNNLQMKCASGTVGPVIIYQIGD